MSLLRNLLTKGALAGAYAGAGYLTSSIISHSAQEKRAYYGDREFTSRFGSTYDVMSGAAKVAGLGVAGLSLIGGDPISIVKNTAQRARQVGKWKNVIRASQKPRMVVSNVPTPSGVRQEGRMIMGSSAAADMARERIKNIHYPAYTALRAGIGVAAVGAASYGMLSNPIATAATTSLGALGAAAMIPGVRNIIKDNALGIGMGTAALVAGSSVALNRSVYPAAEGNITSAEYDQESVVRRLNYNTAGLTQALYRNRKG